MTREKWENLIFFFQVVKTESIWFYSNLLKMAIKSGFDMDTKDIQGTLQRLTTFPIYNQNRGGEERTLNADERGRLQGHEAVK